MHGDLPARGPGGAGERARLVGVPEGDREIVRDDRLLLAGEGAAQDEERAPEARAAELHRLRDARDAQRLRAGVEEGPRRRHGAVPVGVGLHHRHHRHVRPAELTRPAAVVPQGGEAHLGDRRSSVAVDAGLNQKTQKYQNGDSAVEARSAVVSPPVRGYRLGECVIVQIVLNEEPRTFAAGATVADLVGALGLGPRRIAVEVNRAVVPRTEYGSTVLHDGDTVEVIHFVGGG